MNDCRSLTDENLKENIEMVEIHYKKNWKEGILYSQYRQRPQIIKINGKWVLATMIQQLNKSAFHIRKRTTKVIAKISKEEYKKAEKIKDFGGEKERYETLFTMAEKNTKKWVEE